MREGSRSNVKVVVVAVRAAEPQLLTRFATFAEPSPVAGS